MSLKLILESHFKTLLHPCLEKQKKYLAILNDYKSKFLSHINKIVIDIIYCVLKIIYFSYICINKEIRDIFRFTFFHFCNLDLL